MTIETHTILTTAAKSIDVTSRFTPDPSAATPFFALSPRGSYTRGSYVAGAWRAGSTWSSTTGQIVATTPTIGGSASLVITAGEWWVWQKVTVGSETFDELCAIVECPA